MHSRRADVYTSTYIRASALKSRKSASRGKTARGRYKGGGFKPLPVAETLATYAAKLAVARVFQSGNSQAVRLPRDFRVDADELLIFRRGEDIVLREKNLKLSERLARIPSLPDDVPDEIPDTAPESMEDF